MSSWQILFYSASAKNKKKEKLKCLTNLINNNEQVH